jgi:hypothetical protein
VYDIVAILDAAGFFGSGDVQGFQIDAVDVVDGLDGAPRYKFEAHVAGDTVFGFLAHGVLRPEDGRVLVKYPQAASGWM